MRFGIKNGKDTGTPEAQTSSARSDYQVIEEKISYQFINISVLEDALTHRSLAAVTKNNDYERLEFLGDAVLDLAVAHLLLNTHPKAREGELSKMRAALVNTSSLAEIAKTIELGPFIKLSRGEINNSGSERASILADVLEAIFGAIYKEGGFDAALKVTEKLFAERIKTVDPRDPKTELQEAVHVLGKSAPKYLLEHIEGPEHNPIFVSIVEIDGEFFGRGKGPTKKASQQAAAEEALSAILKKEE